MLLEDLRPHPPGAGNADGSSGGEKKDEPRDGLVAVDPYTQLFQTAEIA
jgi:hypothetical protein